MRIVKGHITDTSKHSAIALPAEITIVINLLVRVPVRMAIVPLVVVALVLDALVAAQQVPVVVVIVTAALTEREFL